MTPTHAEPHYDENSPCPFCQIAERHPPWEKLAHPEKTTATQDTPFRSDRGDAHLLLSTKSVLAFLDILPMTTGHALVIPRNHKANLAEMRPTEMMYLGAYLPIVARAVMKVIGWTDFNIIQNNGASASQTVFHTHFHIVPRPPLNSSESANKSISGFGRTWTDLDDGDGAELAGKIRVQINAELKGLQEKRNNQDPAFSFGEKAVLSLL